MNIDGPYILGRLCSSTVAITATAQKSGERKKFQLSQQSHASVPQQLPSFSECWILAVNRLIVLIHLSVFFWLGLAAQIKGELELQNRRPLAEEISL